MRLGGRPTGALALGDREDDRAETRGGEHGAAEVETLPARLQSVGGDDLQRGDRECGCDGEIDVEDRPPVELGQDAADEHADRSTSAADRAPGGERLRPLGALEGGHDDREGSRGEHRCAETLARPSGEQGTGAARHGRGERGHGEDAEPGQEHPAPPEQVGCAAAEEQQAAEDERVARDRPADRAAADVEVAGEAGQGDIHGGDVEDHHQLRDQEHGQEHELRAAWAFRSTVPMTEPVAILMHSSPACERLPGRWSAWGSCRASVSPSLSRTILSDVVKQTRVSDVKRMLVRLRRSRKRRMAAADCHLGAHP